MQLKQSLNHLMRRASVFSHLPLVGRWTEQIAVNFSEAHQEGFRRAQTLAQDGAKHIAGLIGEGWTEQQTAEVLDSWLRDHGVKSFFHHSYAWFGERTRFTHINRRMYHQFMPTTRRIMAGEPFILDVAPIVAGYTCDIGYTSSVGPNAELERAKEFLRELRVDIPKFFQSSSSGEDIWRLIDNVIKDAGYDNIHKLYPFSVLGHRVHRTGERAGHIKLLNFGWHSYWSLGSRGIFGQLLNENFAGSLDGLWAIEPHIGGPGFGAKFEEILVVKDGVARWLNQDGAI